MDTHWLRNLATARLQKGVWALKDPEGSKNVAYGALSDIIPTLIRDFEEAAHVFNLHADTGRTMRVLPFRETSGGHAQGVLLLLGATQLRFVKEGGVLQESLIHVREFKKAEQQLNQFRPIFDSFGGLLWKDQKESIMTKEQMIKRLLCDLCRVGYPLIGKGTL